MLSEKISKEYIIYQFPEFSEVVKKLELFERIIWKDRVSFDITPPFVKSRTSVICYRFDLDKEDIIINTNILCRLSNDNNIESYWDIPHTNKEHFLNFIKNRRNEIINKII